MTKKKFWLGILVLAPVFGTVVGIQAQSTSGGKFTLTSIPSRYNGMYAYLEGGTSTL